MPSRLPKTDVISDVTAEEDDDKDVNPTSVVNVAEYIEAVTIDDDIVRNLVYFLEKLLHARLVIVVTMGFEVK